MLHHKYITLKNKKDMETPQTGYQVKTYNVPVKRYCQTLDLRDSPELIAEYRKRHSHVILSQWKTAQSEEKADSSATASVSEGAE